MSDDATTGDSTDESETRKAVGNPRETYRRMAAIANDKAASDAERETARRIMAIYVTRYGSEVEIPEAEKQIDHDIKIANDEESQLALHCAIFTGCGLFHYGKVLWKGSKRETFRRDGTAIYRGPESVVRGTVELFELHRVKQAKVMEVAATAYRWGAMRLPASTKTNEIEMPKEFDEVATAAAIAGRSYANKRLTAPKKE